MRLNGSCGMSEDAMTTDQAQRHCERVTKQSGSNFVHSFAFLSPDRREAMYAVYAFCQEVDHAVDHPKPGVDIQEKLDTWRAQVIAMYSGTPTFPVAIGLAKHAKNFDIPREYFEELISGVEMDLTIRRYATFTDLYQYCYRVASVVGLISIKVFGTQSPRANEYAVNLGIAFQLSNILRDIGVDAKRDRIYLPQEDLIRFGYPERDMFANANTPAFQKLMAFQARRAHKYYAKAQAALPPEDRKALLVAEIMRGVYFRILSQIEKDPARVFQERVRVPSPLKAAIAVQTWIRIMIQQMVASTAPKTSHIGEENDAR
ncbi:MAG TPA: squalene synthase HpnD [Nitrospirales bacterium]|nr:squalene synthase HpnD [Nitrospirales bacterium]